MSLPFVRFRVACSSGTYIRSLAHSLGTRLGCGAVLTELTREYSHPFGLDLARDPADFTADPTLLPGCVQPLSAALPCWPAGGAYAGRSRAGAQRRGRALPHGGHGERALLLEQGRALALAQRAATPAGPAGPFCGDFGTNPENQGELLWLWMLKRKKR